MDKDQTNDRARTEDVVGELIRQAGRRENPTGEEYERVFSAVSDALHVKLRKRRRRFVAAGLAAALVVGVAVAMLVAPLVTRWPVAPTPALATLDRVVGPAEYLGTDGSGWGDLPDEGADVVAGARIRTGPGSRLGVLMANGVSLRLAASTEVRFAGPGRVELVDGKVYADAAIDVADTASSATRRIEVETPAGTTWDVGTQFEVRYSDDLYRLRVREGRVNLRQDDREFESLAGEQLMVDAARNVQRDRIAKDDEEWRWTETVAPDPSIDARPVSALLRWVSRQTGRDVEFARPGLQLKAETTMLYGSVHFVEPLEALETMLATTDFDYTLLEDGTILVDSIQ